ncbi:MAG TPA: hypothetical protein VGZ73_25200 [Bryobacteraceae bacterium]|jgi:hypothetical protein|nr:hypothetical protein [Bryobacteraceae bacterium]
MNTTVICIRRHRAWSGALRDFGVFVDGTRVGGVENGGEAIFKVSPGRHSIYVKIDFYQSKPCVVDLDPGESTSLVCGVAGLVSALSQEGYLYLRSEGESDHIDATKGSEPQADLPAEVTVRLESEEERVPAATEDIHLPKGVKIKVKRSRMVEHTVEVDWTVAGQAQVDAGFKQILSGSIRGEVSHKQGRTATESETVEYEVELDGEKCSPYRLCWTDIWRKGTAEFRRGGTTRIVPFRYRDRSELAVVEAAAAYPS